ERDGASRLRTAEPNGLIDIRLRENEHGPGRRRDRHVQVSGNRGLGKKSARVDGLGFGRCAVSLRQLIICGRRQIHVSLRGFAAHNNRHCQTLYRFLSSKRPRDHPHRVTYCMNQPWLTTIDWPVNAFDPKDARNNAVSATSSTVVNSPSTVSFSITFLMTSCSEMPSSLACSGICLSTSGVRTKPGQITLARTPWAAPSLATTFARPMRPCLAVT